MCVYAALGSSDGFGCARALASRLYVRPIRHQMGNSLHTQAWVMLMERRGECLSGGQFSGQNVFDCMSVYVWKSDSAECAAWLSALCGAVGSKMKGMRILLISLNQRNVSRTGYKMARRFDYMRLIKWSIYGNRGFENHFTMLLLGYYHENALTFIA